MNKKKLLVIVDMIQGFVKEGNMADPYINHITPEVLRLTKKFMEEGEDVIAFKDMHEIGCKEFTKFPEHCVKGTKECELVEELQVYEPQMTVIPKNSTNGFITPAYQNYLRINQHKIREIVVCGCCTDICVTNFTISQLNDIDQKNLDIEVIVPENAIETYDAEVHPRDQYHKMGKILMKQAGAKLVKKY